MHRRAEPARCVVSFDVFDTVLSRRVGDPEAVVAITARRLAGLGPADVDWLTIAAERRAQQRWLKRLLNRHATLREIYEAVTAALVLDPAAADLWATTEEQVERELSVALPGARRRIAEARGAGCEVVFISDTPHSEAFVLSLLQSHDLLRPGDRVFTSADRRVSKSDGGIFRLVAGELGNHGRFSHLGDHDAFDLLAPRIEGWDGHLVTAGAMTRYETILERFADETGGVTSWLAGASRVARLEAREDGVPADLADVASGCLAPLLVGHALWVLAQARRRGLRRLYYVARDGHIMLEVARVVFAEMAPDIELRYLYGSRQPWTLGAGAIDEGVLRRWITTTSEHTARTALTRVGLTPEQVHAVEPTEVTAPSRCDELMTVAQRDALAEALQREPLLGLVRATAREHADLCIAYFRQEGLCDLVPSALVDAGWAGRTSLAFDLLLEAAGGEPKPHLFIGVTGSREDARRAEGVDMVPWLFDEQTYPSSLMGLRGPNVVVEMFCAATTGRTMGYRREGDRLLPLFDVDRNEPVIAWGLPRLQQIAVRVAELVASDLPSSHIDTARFARSVLREFWVKPTGEEVAAWGTFPWEEEVATPFVPIAQRITTRTVLERLARGERRLRRQNGWRAGSATVSAQPWSALLRWRAWLDDNRGRVRNIPRRLRLERVRLSSRRLDRH